MCLSSIEILIRPGDITQQGMTFLIRSPVESEIGALSFYWQPGLRVQGSQGGSRGGQGPGRWAAWLAVASAGPVLLRQPLPMA